MTDTELVAAIRKIIRVRPRKGITREQRDLEKFDQIVGLITRHSPTRDTPPAAPSTK